MDKWLDDQSIADLAPSLVPLVAKRIMRSRTVCQALTTRLWVRDLSGALSVAALVDYLHLWQPLEDIQLQPDLEDIVRWKWTGDGCYSAKSAYQVNCNWEELPSRELIVFGNPGHH